MRTSRFRGNLDKDRLLIGKPAHPIEHQTAQVDVQAGAAGGFNLGKEGLSVLQHEAAQRGLFGEMPLVVDLASAASPKLGSAGACV